MVIAPKIKQVLRGVMMSQRPKPATLPPSTQHQPRRVSSTGLPAQPKLPSGRPAKQLLPRAGGMFGMRRGTPR